MFSPQASWVCYMSCFTCRWTAFPLLFVFLPQEAFFIALYLCSYIYRITWLLFAAYFFTIIPRAFSRVFRNPYLKLSRGRLVFACVPFIAPCAHTHSHALHLAMMLYGKTPLLGDCLMGRGDTNWGKQFSCVERGARHTSSTEVLPSKIRRRIFQPAS